MKLNRLERSLVSQALIDLASKLVLSGHPEEGNECIHLDRKLFKFFLSQLAEEEL